MRLIKHLFFVFSLCLQISASAAQYTLIVDAGSSGSRLYIYKFIPTKHLDKLKLTQVSHLKIEPGISALVSTRSPQIIKRYIAPLIQFAKNNIPKNKQTSTPLYWYSTAGMRLVSATQQQKAYQLIKKTIEKTSPFKVKAIKTISGKTEGTLMWLGVNYKVGALETNQYIGILDMGGASTQIVFPAFSEKNANIRIKLGNNIIHLFSYSFLGLGRNEIRHQFSNDRACFSRGYRLPNGSVATGYFKQCKKEIHQFLLTRHKVRKKITPIRKMNYVAFDGFYKTLGALKSAPSFNINQLNRLGQDTCQLKKQTQAKNTDAYTHCFNTAYFSTLLTQYGFSNDTHIRISDGSWTLGAAVLIATEGNLID